MANLFSARLFKVIQPVVVILALVLAAPTSGEARDIYKECNGGNDIAVIVPACSAVLQRGARESAGNRKQAFFYRGYAYQCTNRLDEGFADYRAALAIDPDYFPPKNNLSAGFSRRGGDAYNRKDYGQALSDFAEALKLKPNDPQSLNNLAAIHYKEGHFDQAIPLCTSASQNDPKSTAAYICGRSYLGKGDLKNAVIALTKVQALDPGHKDADDPQSPLEALDQAKRMLAEAAPPVVPSRPAVEPAAIAPIAESTAQGENRVALVIGNDHYANVGALSNPRQDATLVAAALKNSGFTSVTPARRSQPGWFCQGDQGVSGPGRQSRLGRRLLCRARCGDGRYQLSRPGRRQIEDRSRRSR